MLPSLSGRKTGPAVPPFSSSTVTIPSGRDIKSTSRPTQFHLPTLNDAAFGIVLLVVILRPVKIRGRKNLSHYFFAEISRFLHRFPRTFCLLLLSLVVAEYDRPVLLANVWPLAVERGWVVAVPEYIQKLLV